MRDPDDAILNALGSLAREDAVPVDPRFETLVQGELSKDATTALAELAVDDETLARDLALFTPFDAAQNEAIMGAVLADLMPAQLPVDPLAPTPPPIRRRAFMGLGIAAAFAAALFFMLSPKTPSVELLPAPAYSLTVGASEQAHLSAAEPEAGLPTYSKGSRIELRLRPQTALTGDIAVKVVRKQGAQTDVWPMTVIKGSKGAMKLRAEADTLPVGLWTLEVHLTQAGHADRVLTAQVRRTAP